MLKPLCAGFEHLDFSTPRWQHIKDTVGGSHVCQCVYSRNNYQGKSIYKRQESLSEMSEPHAEKKKRHHMQHRSKHGGHCRLLYFCVN